MMSVEISIEILKMKNGNEKNDDVYLQTIHVISMEVSIEILNMNFIFYW